MLFIRQKNSPTINGRDERYFFYNHKFFLLTVVFALLFTFPAFSQYSISGKVLDSKTKKPIEFATVSIPLSSIWTTANAKGEFLIKKIPSGTVKIAASYLGFVKNELTIKVDQNLQIELLLDEDNLSLATVEVNAKRGTDLATSYIMDRKALDHLQMLQITDISSLMPGGKTNTNINLATTGAQRLTVNGTSSERGNASFGVGLEIDGVRVSNNSFREQNSSINANPVNGPDTKNISTTNIESIEVITGLPSVEYGDMTNGMVKINTRKGVSPFNVELATRPSYKSIALSKGLSLGQHAGVLNFNIEHSKSISNLASPYTNYERNSLSVNYSNTFNKNNNRPLLFNFGVTGNLGGFNSVSDPDLFDNTFTKNKDNTLRANLSAKWLLKLPWITSVEASGTVNYNDKLSEVSTLKSSTSSVPSIHATEQGYHVGELYANNPNADIVLIPRGFWYQNEFNDNKLFNANGRLKANWVKKIGQKVNNLMLGADYSVSGNYGDGIYYGDRSTAPTWRPYPYKNESFMNNYAFFAENSLNLPIKNNNLQIVAGIRSEITDIKNSEYGAISNWSPRFTAKYTFWEKKDQLISDFSIKASWGKTVKLPGFDALYPTPSYRDILSFTPGTTATGETYYAYYTQQRNRIYNPELKWQSNEQREIAVNFNVRGTKVFISAQQDITTNPYLYNQDYTPYFYNYTSQSDLQASNIPIGDRIYTVNKNNGIVTVSDKNGILPAELLSYTSMYGFNSNGYYSNGSPINRKRINWIVDFAAINSINTSVRVDGSYNFYKGLEQTVSAYMPNTTQMMANGKPYKYIGYFVGGSDLSNGELSRALNLNLTVTTHIPSVRLIITAKIEGSLYRYSRNLSESSQGNRSYVIDSRESYTPSATQTDIYGGDRFVATYPSYYTSMDDATTQVPFLEKFLWAKDNDVPLYNELSKMVIRNSNNYNFNESKISSYYSANLAITKEFGKYASLSFFANNFTNNMGKVTSSLAGTTASLFGSSYIPAFNYGATLRLKF